MRVSKIVNLGFITRLKAYIQREQLILSGLLISGYFIFIDGIGKVDH